MPNTNMPTQRPFFLSTFFASFRQAPNTSSLAQQPNKHTTQSASSSSAAAYAQQQSASSASSNPRAIAPPSATGSVVNQLPLHSPRGAARRAWRAHPRVVSRSRARQRQLERGVQGRARRGKVVCRRADGRRRGEVLQDGRREAGEE
ncbi:uncharacterized protein VDAG_07894 [Verticillium dahliae VdLs.17]|uniref:Uncharacterized protein n=1 Tax=Verticillium dahliae (strain VdLs.17 / ATCC MYA-4575 / FGSC 10137) TaxID=498257 RepID=G2XCL2_VERDV|nr:uncharacterized protein VDAG_07894 [Verticillium dahliae VdLs.17]EGY16730.1 hypothetical protein VDAG_07894 [Verticillium dahliae VdLs.17]